MNPQATTLSLWSVTMPVAMGYIPLGMVFGFLFVQAGGEGWWAVLASVLVYAGAAQYMMIPMLVAGASVLSIAVATLVINARHVFYGLSLLHRLPASGVGRWYAVFALTDETYSVLTTLPPDTPPAVMVRLALLNQVWWVLGTLLGVVLGEQWRITWSGLDFVLVSLFAVLAVEQWRHRSSSAPLWWALVSYALAYWYWPQQALVLSMAACVGLGLCWPASQATVSGGRA